MRFFRSRRDSQMSSIRIGSLLIKCLHQLQSLLGGDFTLLNHLENLIAFLVCHFILHIFHNSDFPAQTAGW